MELRQERREKRKANGRAKMLKHGKGLAKIYKDAIYKRVKEAE